MEPSGLWYGGSKKCSCIMLKNSSMHASVNSSISPDSQKLTISCISSSLSKWSSSNQNDSFMLMDVAQSCSRSKPSLVMSLIVLQFSTLRMPLLGVGKRKPTILRLNPRRLCRLRLLVSFRKILVSLFLLQFAVTYGADVVSVS